MPLMIKDLQALVWEDYAGKEGVGPAGFRTELASHTSYQQLTEEEQVKFSQILSATLGNHLDRIVELTVKRLGMSIAHNGEVVDPRPAPAPSGYPEQRGPSYSRYDRGRRRR
jgi:hypothetical protein